MAQDIFLQTKKYAVIVALINVLSCCYCCNIFMSLGNYKGVLLISCGNKRTTNTVKRKKNEEKLFVNGCQQSLHSCTLCMLY